MTLQLPVPFEPAEHPKNNVPDSATSDDNLWSHNGFVRSETACSGTRPLLEAAFSGSLL